MVIPPWLQVVGRMHPLLLHFPIALLILYIIWSLFLERKFNENGSSVKYVDGLLLLSALTASLTALMGIFLSREDDYDPNALLLHKWSGILISVLTCVWYAFKEKIKNFQLVKIPMALMCFAAVIVAGHQGAGITHGKDYVFAPIMKVDDAPQVLLEDAEVYAHMVRPILQSKCMSCHNSRKAKGELVMETEETLLKGGKTGKLWDSTAEDYGLLIQRIHLPLEAKKHMPPKGKPQLTEEEVFILYAWIKGNADFKTKVIDLNPDDTLRQIASNIFQTIENDNYEFAAADDRKIQKLNNNYRVVYPLAASSPALGAEFFSAQNYSAEQLKDLLAVKDQVVSLNLNKMPVKDEELKIISQFDNLRRLNLAFTSITGSTLKELNKLKELKHLSLSGTSINERDLSVLSSMQNLSRLYVWNVPLQNGAIEKLKQSMKDVNIETGYNGDTTVLKLTPPILQNEEQIIVTPIPLKLKHYINGVTIRYTIDGTEPDSLRSPEYNKGIELNTDVTVKAKAYKRGWISSDAIEMRFFKAGYKPDSVTNILQPDAQYKGDGAATLTDLVKGETNNIRSGKWLGYRNNRFESLLIFNSTPNVSKVTLSTLVDIGGYIMPPMSIEVWGGDDPKKLKLLHKLSPQQPSRIEKPSLQAFESSFSAVRVRYLKVIATTVTKLPLWHPGKGDKGWVFVDEIFVN